jgi:hypothetical protein
MRQIDRSIVGSDGHDYLKMVFRVTDDPHVGTESMWVEVVGDGRFRLKNIPGRTPGVALDDVVLGRQVGGRLEFIRTDKRAGHSTYRVAFQSERPGPENSETLDSLRALGCGFERLSDRLVAIDVPPEVDIHEAHAVLDQGMADGNWWFDELHCGHPV